MVCFVQLLYIHKKNFKQPLIQDQIQVPYLPFLSESDPHWDNYANMFTLVNVKYTGKTDREFQQESNKTHHTLFSHFAYISSPIFSWPPFQASFK